MNIIVHIMFSCRMRGIIRKEAGIKLNILGFIIGNVLPDLSPSFGGLPHNMHESLDYVVKSAHNLLKKSGMDGRRQSYRHSRDFGVITHYISDFFCHPHQEHYDKGFKDHSIYEFRMIARYRKGIRDYKKRFSRSYYSIAPDEFNGWILDRHENYMRQGVSYENDISYALYAGSMIGRSMFLHLLREREEGCVERARSQISSRSACSPQYPASYGHQTII